MVAKPISNLVGPALSLCSMLNSLGLGNADGMAACVDGFSGITVCKVTGAVSMVASRLQ